MKIQLDQLEKLTKIKEIRSLVLFIRIWKDREWISLYPKRLDKNQIIKIIHKVKLNLP